MSFRYPDFSKYFAGPQRLPTEIMMMIHDWGRNNIKLRGENLPDTWLDTFEDNAVYDVCPNVRVSINSQYHDLDEPFMYVWFGWWYLYLEYHDAKTLVVRRVYRAVNDSYRLLRRELLYPNGKVIVRCGGPQRSRTDRI
jgi:hypothetical protein